jgi:hypothetical protein
MPREDVIRQIVARDIAQRGLMEEIVQQDDASLHRSACDHFGTWETALEYAGVDMRARRPRQTFTTDQVLCEIRRLCVSGYSLAAGHNMHRDRRLYDAARQHFGTWRKALVAAGVNLNNAFVRRPRKLDRGEILAAIRQRDESGQSLAWTDVCLENRALATAAKHAFGSWRNAIQAAESESDHPKPGL